jgi:hypothetical protein
MAENRIKETLRWLQIARDLDHALTLYELRLDRDRGTWISGLVVGIDNHSIAQRVLVETKGPVALRA